MRSKFKKLFMLLTVLACTACGSSSQSTSSTETKAEAMSGYTVSRGEQSSNRLRDLLLSKYEDETSLMTVVPFFIDSPSLEVVSDPDYKNLEVNATAFIDSPDASELKYGKFLRIPRENVGGASPNLDGADYICAKDVMQKFTRDILWQIQYDGYLMPEESLKVTVKFYTITGPVKKDEYGNEDYSGQQEKVLVKTLIHISNANLMKISDAYGPDDYYVLSDLTKPVRHLSSWNQCRSWTS
jgi:hypothetical protein